MPRPTHRLTAMEVSKLSEPGLYADGAGLYLRVGPTGAKAWVFRFRAGGKLRDMGLGPVQTVSLKDARAAALECRQQRLEGTDPIATREAGRKAQKLADAKTKTFRECGEAYIAAHRNEWKNAKHAAQWGSTLETYAYPEIGDLSVQAIDTGLVMKVLEPIWSEKTETASRLRGRIEAVLDWATVREYRRGENPARWKGHLDHLLPQRAKVQKVEHHAALPYGEIGGFMETLREQDGTSPLALEFAILTATRTNEVLNATWAEFDLNAAMWTIPADRMKAGREHRVPLSKPALAVLEKVRPLVALKNGSSDPAALIFPGGRKGKPLSSMALLMTLRRMERGDLTVHGFRSTFRDWAAERTNFPREVAEHALAHRLPDKVEAAYQRGDLFEKRRKLMEAWGGFCDQRSNTANIVAILAV